MKTKSIILLTLFALLLIFQGSCDKDGSKPFYLSCKINGEKWDALKYESLLSNRQVLAASAYYDPDIAWLKFGAGRSIKTPSHPGYYMQGSMSINIIDFKGEGSYTLIQRPPAGPGISYLLQNWAWMEINYADPMPGTGIYTAITTDEYTGVCTITMFDEELQIIEGKFHFDASHISYDAVANVTKGKFRLQYEIIEINKF